jgi:UDP-N-acetylglucosamine 2-epimerase
MRIATLVGARPQFIKAFPVSREIRKRGEEFLIHTGQHYDHGMSRLLFDELGMPEPDANLGVGSGSHAEQTAGILVGVERELLRNPCDVLVVYGDTNSTLSGALAAAKLGMSVAHIEAGMRCGDVSMPEELNRRVTDTVSSLLFCSTEAAVRNLASEGIAEGVHLVGDVMVDALHLALPVVRQGCDILDTLALEENEFIFCTVHRAANLSQEGLGRIVEALLRVQRKVVFPVHPGTRKMLHQHKLLASLERAKHILIIEPVSYGESLVLQENAYAILTDSGGVQKEAYLLGRPCLTMRDETEWDGTVEAGWNLLVGTDPGHILEGLSSFRPECDRPNLFGDGLASQRIAEALSDLGSGA